MKESVKCLLFTIVFTAVTMVTSVMYASLLHHMSSDTATIIASLVPIMGFVIMFIPMMFQNDKHELPILLTGLMLIMVSIIGIAFY